MAKSTLSQKRRTKKVVPVEHGTKLVLLGGKGPKRRYNHKTAIVVSLPHRRNGWMTVQLVREDGDAPTTSTAEDDRIQWRTSRCRLAQQQQQQQQQQPGVQETATSSRTTTGNSTLQDVTMTTLPDEARRHIFSFLVGEPETQQMEMIIKGQKHQSHSWDLWRVGNIQALLRSVSREWKILFDEAMPQWLGLLDANLDRYWKASERKKVLDWLIRTKVRLGSLSFNVALFELLFIRDLLEACDTTHLFKMRAYLNVGRCLKMSSHQYETLVIPDLIDLCDNAVLGELPSEPLVVVYANHQKILHDSIAKNCPNLAVLSLTLTLPPLSSRDAPYISNDLFSMPSIRKLKISLGYHDYFKGWRIGSVEARDTSIFTKLIKKLDNIRELEIATNESSARSSHLLQPSTTYDIESTSLQSLGTFGLWKGIFVSCHCPQLQYFCCNGSFYGNGVRKPPEGFATDDIIEQREDRVVVRHSVENFPSFRVPRSCRMTFKM